MADMGDAMTGAGVVKEEVSTFDGARVVTVNPAWLYTGEGMSEVGDFKLGAKWTSAEPELVGLLLSYEPSFDVDFTTFEALQVNIDGAITSYPAGPTNMDSEYIESFGTSATESTAFVSMPMATLQAMIDAKDCRLRILAGNKYSDAIFSVDRASTGQATARVSLRAFVEKVGVR
jgi:hypothetical protein